MSCELPIDVVDEVGCIVCPQNETLCISSWILPILWGEVTPMTNTRRVRLERTVLVQDRRVSWYGLYTRALYGRVGLVFIQRFVRFAFKISGLAAVTLQ